MRKIERTFLFFSSIDLANKDGFSSGNRGKIEHGMNENLHRTVLGPGGGGGSAGGNSKSIFDQKEDIQCFNRFIFRLFQLVS